MCVGLSSETIQNFIPVVWLRVDGYRLSLIACAQCPMLPFAANRILPRIHNLTITASSWISW